MVKGTGSEEWVFSLIGVDQVFTFCDSVDAALWSFAELATAKDL